MIEGGDEQPSPLLRAGAGGADAEGVRRIAAALARLRVEVS